MKWWWTWIYEWPILQYQSIARNLKKGQFAQNLKNGSDIYEHVHVSKVFTRRTNVEVVCLAVLCVDLSPQEEECISSSWGDSEMYTSSSITNSQGMLTEINESGTIGKIRIWVESNAVKHLKAFRIISSEMQISLILNSWYFSFLHIQIIFFTFIWA